MVSAGLIREITSTSSTLELPIQDIAVETPGSGLVPALLCQGNFEALRELLAIGCDPVLDCAALHDHVWNHWRSRRALDIHYMQSVRDCVQLLIEHGAVPVACGSVPRNVVELATGHEQYMPLFLLASAGLPDVLHTAAAALGGPVPRGVLKALLRTSILENRTARNLAPPRPRKSRSFCHADCTAVLLSLGAQPREIFNDSSAGASVMQVF